MFEQHKADELRDIAMAAGKVLLDEVAAVDFSEVIDETDHYAIRPCIVIERSGQQLPVYGIYNKDTNIREAESRQIGGAKEWLRVLSNAAEGKDPGLPGLDEVMEAPEDNEEE